MQFGGATGQVQRLDATRFQHLGDERQRLGVHHLGAVGPGVDMAVQARLVAAVAQVHLQGAQGLAADGREAGVGQKGEGGVHDVCSGVRAGSGRRRRRGGRRRRWRDGR